MRKKISALFLALALVVTMTPSVLFADDAQPEEYNLYVGGVQVTSENASDILSDGGSVVYDKDSNTLTLTDANINAEFVTRSTGESTYTEHFVGIDYGDSNEQLVIELNGRNTITGYHSGRYGYGIYAANSNIIAFSGQGWLDINIDSTLETNYGIYLEDWSDLYFNGSEQVNITSAGTSIYCESMTLRDDAAVTVESGVNAIELGRTHGDDIGAITVENDASLEVYTSGTNRSAILYIDEDKGNIKTVGACGGYSRDEANYEHWTGDYGDPDLSSYTYVKIPYEDSRSCNITFEHGTHSSGSMDPMKSFKGGRIALPESEFQGDYTYYFTGWKLSGDTTVYHPGDHITITEDTVVTARWACGPMDLFIGGVQVTEDNVTDVFHDGTVSVQLDPDDSSGSLGQKPKVIRIILDNATIEADRRSDGQDRNIEYGIRYEENTGIEVQLELKGKNKIINKHSYVGIKEVTGIRTLSDKNFTIMGDGTLDIDFNAERTDGSYFGIDNMHPSFIDGVKVNVNIGGRYEERARIKGYNIDGRNTLSLVNNAEFNINTNYGLAFDNNNKDEGDVDLDVEKGSKFQATSMWSATDSWYAIHGNGWVTFSEGSLAQEVLVGQNIAGDDLSVWDGTTDIGTYRIVRIPNEKIPPETTVPETTKAPTPKPAKKANTIKVKTKKKTIKAKKLKKKSVKVKAFKIKKAIGKVTFKKVKKGTTKKIYKKVKVSKKGVLKFKKGKYKKKTYKVKVKITAKGNNTYLSKIIKKTIKVKIK